MAILLKNPEVEQLARRLAAERGQSITTLILQALRREHQQPAPRILTVEEIQALPVDPVKVAALQAIADKTSQLPSYIEGDYNDFFYDENGLPH